MRNLLLTLWLLVITIIPNLQAQDNLKIAFINENIGTGSDIDWFQTEVEKEINNLLHNRVEVAFEVFYGAYDPVKMLSDFEKAFNDPTIDIVISMGAMASGILAQRGNYSKPAIAGIILDTQMQQVPITAEGTSGILNFTYAQSPFSVQRDIEKLYRLRPFQNLVVIGGNNLTSYLPFLDQLINSRVDILGASSQLIPYQGAVDKTINAIPENADAVYLLPIFDEMTQVEQKSFFQKINQKGLPSMALLGELYVNEGAMMGFEADANLQRMPRRIALNVLKIFEGAKAEDLPVEIPTYNETLLINMATARVTGVYPDFDLMAEAILLNVNVSESGRKLNLKGTITEALQNNLGLKVAEADPQIAQKDVALAKSEFLPSADVSSNMVLIDESSAELSFGSRGRMNWLASGSLSQLIYSEPALANVAIQKLFQKGEEAALEQTQLDVVIDAATAFLNVLQAESGVRIQNDNVFLTKENYDISKAKEAVGYSGVSDLYRWTTELALRNIDLNDAQARYNQAKFQLNQFLNRPINEAFNTEEVTLGQQMLLVTDMRAFKLVNNYGDLEKFANFLVAEAMDRLPELKQFDYNIGAVKRQQLSQKRAFYLPSIALSGQIDHTIQRFKTVELIPGLPLPEPDSKPTWNIGAGLKYPLFQGGQRKLNLEKTELSLLQVQNQRADLENQMELRIRATMETVAASFSRMDLSRQAADAARKNFEIVQDSYSQGLVNITTLIDAQNASLQTELSAVNAIYTFILDWLELERSVGFYYFTASKEEQDAFFERLAAFMAQGE